MKIRNTEITEGELTILCGENAKSNCTESLMQAVEVSKRQKGKNVLYINTVFSKRKMFAAMRSVMSSHVPGSGEIALQNVTIGNLCNDLYRTRLLIAEKKISFVIINSWEFAHKNYSAKERALFDLMELVNSTGVTVLVYSQAKLAEAGKIQRGGLGKLSGFADEVISLNETSHQTRTPNPDTRSEKLDALKINNLEYARSNSEVSSGGELVLPKEEEVFEDIREEQLMEV